MLVQSITNRNYNNYQIQKRNNSVSLKGELGADVLKKISTSGAKDKKEILQVLKTFGIGFIGLFSLRKLADIMEAVIAKNNELDEKEKSIINVEQMLNEAEKSALRALYGVQDSELETAESFSEQMLHVNSILSENSDKILDLESTTPISITKALRNKSNMIDAETLTFFNRLIAMIDQADVEDIERAIHFVKDSSNNLDTEKAAQFLILLSNKGHSISDIMNDLSGVRRAAKKSDNYTVEDTEFGYGKVTLTQDTYKKYVNLMKKLERFKLKSQSTQAYLDQLENRIDWMNSSLHEKQIGQYFRKRDRLEPRIGRLKGKIASLEVQIKSILENSNNQRV